MKFRAFLLVLAAALIAGPALADKIYIEYDRDYDGSKMKTFAWSSTEQTSLMESQPFLHSKIVETIAGFITASGLKQVDDNPDVYVTYHGSSKEEMNVDTAYLGYSYPGAWGYGRYGGYGGYYSSSYGGVYGGYGATVSATVTSYKVGTLIVDIWDAKTKKLIPLLY